LNITEVAKGVTGAIKEWWQSEDGQNFANTMVGIFDDITEDIDCITDAIRRIWENGGKEVFTLLWDILHSLIEIIGLVVRGFFNFWAAIFEKKAEDAEKSQLSGIRDILEKIKSFLTWLKGDGKPILEAIGNGIGLVVAAYAAWKVAQAATGAITFLAGLANPMGLVKLAIMAIVAVLGYVITHWDEIKVKAKEVLDKLKEWVDNAKQWISDKFTAMKDTIVNIWQGIKDGIKGAVNGILGFINGLIRGVTNGVNTVIRALNKIQVHIPDWVPEWGGRTIGFHLQEVQAPQIPLLASGGIAYDNALVGVAEYSGSRSNPEVIAPLDKLESILQKSGGGNITVQSVIVLDDGTIVGRAVKTIRRSQRLGMGVVA
jgi:phage-related protein